MVQLIVCYVTAPVRACDIRGRAISQKMLKIAILDECENYQFKIDPHLSGSKELRINEFMM